ncbi:MAG TPA: aminotransferase class III-fold pyridoxal phosphate-dependent enzyme, partial [Actinomycetota bacterium]|nr:aminotransferase class III-fold pyridoxal phosphate-dependent enzyme [Actinomycetota bacterium]
TGPQVELAERLVGHFGGDAKVFLSNSGAEANEAAIKVARRWGRANRGEQATGIVATLGGFHGRTLATLAATGKPAMHTPFQPLPPGFSHVPFGDVDALAAAIGPDTAAVLVEPIQGEAGIRVPPPGYLRAVRELTTRAGVLLIVDEIQSGMGRTGRFFAHQHDEIRPDVVTMAKALGSGYPIGATIARTEVADAMQRGDHGTTFGGNPVACTAALATLDVIEPLLGGHVDKVSTRLADGLVELRGRLTGRSTWAPPTADEPDDGLPGAEVRGAGLWFALELGPEAPTDARRPGRPGRQPGHRHRPAAGPAAGGHRGRDRRRTGPAGGGPGGGRPVSLKAARQQALAALLRTRQVSSQALVLEHLRAQGFDATQATISRDLDDLGAVKVRGPDGRLVYALPEPGNGHGADHDEIRRMLGGSLLAIIPSGNLVVLRTPPGHAAALASTLDRAGIAGVAGTVAGDDTVLVVCTERTPGRAMARQLAALAVTPVEPRAIAEPYRGATA